MVMVKVKICGITHLDRIVAFRVEHAPGELIELRSDLRVARQR
jgi:hypothetical protein